MPNVRVAIVHPETKQPCAITDLGEVKLYHVIVIVRVIPLCLLASPYLKQEYIVEESV